MNSDVNTNVRANSNVQVETSKQTQSVSKESTDAPKEQQVEKLETTQVDTVELQSIVDEINEYVQDVRREIRFQVEEESGKTIITVLDQGSEEVIRQIPSEEVVKMAQFLKTLSVEEKDNSQLMNGLILELRA